MPAIIIKEGVKAEKLKSKPLSDEKLLQKYIIENPECLPMEEIEEDLRLLVVAREFPAGNGSIDALGLDQEGASTS
jgi:RecB family endonuclease NucS